MKSRSIICFGVSGSRRAQSFLVLLLMLLSHVPLMSQISYFCDFEDDTELQNWTFNAGNRGEKATNKWYVGSAINNGGKRSLYISSDGGATATYQAAATTITSYRTFTLPKGDYEISFDWQAFGYSKCDATDTITDALYFLWMPDSVKSNSQTSNSILPAYVGNYAVKFNGSSRLSGHTWNTVSGTISSDGVTPYKMVFVWNNNSRYSFPPGASVDNISIVPKGVCEKPSDIEIELLEDEKIKIKWSGDADAYDIRCKSTTDTKWQEYVDYQGNEIIVSDIGEGVCDVFIRSKCGRVSSVWASHSQFVYYPGTRCVDYMNLTPGNCFFGVVGSPTSSRGVVDNGYLAMSSRHTIHYNRAEVDPRTNGSLPTVPDGEIASVRLGNWNAGGQAEAIQYDYLVDTAENAILLLKYAVVLQDPGHDEEEQPRFTLQILDNGFQLDDDGCAEADFSAGFVSESDGWHEVGTSSNKVEWKDWTTVGINLKEYHNKNLTIKLVTYDCKLSGHYGYAYFTLGCNDGRIQGLSCGESARNRFKAPDGFLYRWYLPDRPNNTLSTDQIFEVDPMDTLTYSCDVIQPTKKECYYTVSANATPRYPVAKGIVKQEVRDCRNFVTFYDSSYVHHVNPETGRIERSRDDCDSVVWHFLDDGTSCRATEAFEKEFPKEGGVFRVMLTAHLVDCYSDTVFEISLPKLGASIDTVRVVECNASSYRWDRTNQYYFSSGFYCDTASVGNEYGCEDITVLDLTLVNIKPTELEKVVCSQDLPYIFGDRELYESGTYTDTLLSYQNCDSVVRLELTVNESLEFDESCFQLSAYGCADDENIKIPYVLRSGKASTYDIVFDDIKADRLLGVKEVEAVEPELLIALSDSILPGRYSAKVLFRNADCGDVTLPLELDIYYPSSIITQRWNDVLAIYNSGYNGGYEFIAYQWLKNGQPMEGEIKSILYVPEGLDIEAAYSTMLTRTTDGVTALTCEVHPQYFADVEVMPTVTFSGGIINVKSDNKGIARMWNAMGQLVCTYVLQNGYNEIKSPGMAGTYLLELIFEDGSRRTEKIAVRDNAR